MFVERINTVSSELQLDPKDLASLGLPENVKPPEGDIAPLIVPAAEWIERTFGVILRAGEFRMTQELPAAPAVARRDLRIPIGPVISGVVKVGGKISESVKVRRGYVAGVGPQAQRLVIEFMAGWAGGMIPKSVAIAVAMVCRRWLEHPEEQAKGEVGVGLHTIGHLLELFGGGRPAGGVPWR